MRIVCTLKVNCWESSDFPMSMSALLASSVMVGAGFFSAATDAGGIASALRPIAATAGTIQCLQLTIASSPFTQLPIRDFAVQGDPPRDHAMRIMVPEANL